MRRDVIVFFKRRNRDKNMKQKSCKPDKIIKKTMGKDKREYEREREKKESLLLKRRAKDYIIITLVSHGIGLAVFTPYNLAVLNFSADQLIRNAIASTGIAFAWNYFGYRLTAACSEKVKRIFGGQPS